MRLLLTAVVLCAAASPAWAQAFANAKSSLANYSVADSAPKKTCESLSTFKGKDVVAIQARVVPATADTPQHCRVDRNDLAGGRVRDQPARSLEPAFLHDRERRPRR